MANEDFTRFTSEETPLPPTPRAYSNITEEEEEYVAGSTSTPEGAPTQGEPATPEAEPVEIVTPIEKPKTIVFSLVSLILGIVSLVYGLSGIVGAIFGVVAIVFAIISRVHLGYFDTKCIIGLILGIVGTIFGAFIATVDLLGFFSEAGSFFEEIIDDAVNGDFNHQA